MSPSLIFVGDELPRASAGPPFLERGSAGVRSKSRLKWRTRLPVAASILTQCLIPVAGLDPSGFPTKVPEEICVSRSLFLLCRPSSRPKFISSIAPFVAGLAFLVTSLVNAQGAVTIPSAEISPGEPGVLSLFVATSEPTYLMFLEIDGLNGAAFDPLYVEPGAALQAYSSATGDVPECDIIVFPDSTVVLMPFQAQPFSSLIFGSEVMRLVVTPQADTLGTFPICYTFMTEFNLVNLTTSLTVVASEPTFIRGDANADQLVNVADVNTLIGGLYLGEEFPSCADACDANDDGLVDIADVVDLLNNLFVSGNGSVSSCGEDSTYDTLPLCERDC